jgi:hypothetical protein
LPTLLTGERGDPVSVAVQIDDASDIMAFDITLSFDDASLAFVQAQLSNCVPGQISSEWLVNASVAEPGSLRIIGLGFQPLPGNGDACALVDVDLEIKGDAPETSCSDIAVTDVALSDSQAHSIAAIPGGGAELCIGPPVFPDVLLDNWAFRYIGGVVDAGVASGYDDGLYHPDLTVSRDQMAVFIARGMCGGDDQVPELDCVEPPFSDVTCDHWARKYIQYAASEGVVQGYPEGDYKPEDFVNRAQMAVYMCRAFDLPM